MRKHRGTRVHRSFPFEDFTLILTRDCNFACEYCPLDHQDRRMTEGVLRAFFPQLKAYADRDVLVTLFGGEPLMNRRAFEEALRGARGIAPRYAAAGGRLWLKVVTNGSLLEERLELLARSARVPGLELELNISIDGSRATQLRQRPLRRSPNDYYAKLARAISAAKKIGAQVSLGMVAGFESPSLTDDFKSLGDAFGLPVFIMPVNLTHAFITSRPDMTRRVERYARGLKGLLAFLKANPAYGRLALNLSEQKSRDLKALPLGPTIDWDGSVYATRSFLFPMDPSYSFTPIGALTSSNLGHFVGYFSRSRERLARVSAAAMRTYFGRTLSINRGIGNYFMRQVRGSAAAR